MGQHMGDLENIETMDFVKETLKNLANTFHAHPEAVAHDAHPDYVSTRMARDYAQRASIPPERVFAVQHHHAHVAACMAEHGLSGPVVGVAFDGTGYGTDGTVWGGEFLLSDLRGFTRAAHLAPVPLPGGDRAAREPWRCALSYLRHAYGAEALTEAASDIIERVGTSRAGTVIDMMEKGVNSPLTSSAGRLFDAVASITGLVDEITFEAEAARRLESVADIDNPLSTAYGISDIIDGTPLIVDHAPLVRSVAEDVRNGVETPVVSARFHRGLAGSIVDVARRLARSHGTKDVVISGGVFQNRTLTGLVAEGLAGAGLTAWTHERVPPNDGGVSLGQAVVASALLKGE
jgi:hydrogenase maturation protein HypF